MFTASYLYSSCLYFRILDSGGWSTHAVFSSVILLVTWTPIERRWSIFFHYHKFHWIPRWIILTSVSLMSLWNESMLLILPREQRSLEQKLNIIWYSWNFIYFKGLMGNFSVPYKMLSGKWNQAFHSGPWQEKKSIKRNKRFWLDIREKNKLSWRESL